MSTTSRSSANVDVEERVEPFNVIAEDSLGYREESPRRSMVRLDMSGRPTLGAEPGTSGLIGLVAGELRNIAFRGCW